jgi:MFS family permease
MRQAFATPGFRRLFIGLSASMCGDSLMLIVLSMWVKALTHSNGRAGLTFFWMVVPALFAPVFGMYVDRVRRRPLLIWCNVASAAIVLPLLFVRDAGDVWIIYLVALLYGVSFIVIPAGLNGLLKELLPENLLVEANASLATIKEGFRLIGPLAGAGLFAAVGGGAVAIVDAASFLVAAAAVANLKLSEAKPERKDQHWRAEMSAGARHIVREPILKHVLVALALTIFVIGFTESAVYAILDAFHKPVEFVGVIITVQGVGAIAGGLTSSRLIRRLTEAGGIAVGLGVLAISMAVIAGVPVLWVVMVATVLFGYSLPVLIIAANTLIQVRTPNALMGRVSTATDVLLGVPQAVSIALGALLVTFVNYQWVYALMAVATSASVVYLVIALKGRLFTPEQAILPAVAGPATADQASVEGG